MATKASQWKGKQSKADAELDLPSGNTVKVRRIKPEAFLEGGMIPDALAGIVQKAINSKKGLPPKMVEELAKDPEKISAALETFDRALVFCVIEPVVEMAPGCNQCTEKYTARVHIDRRADGFHRYVEDGRDEEVLYSDDVSLEDKQMIFQWAVGGVADISKFRGELAAVVESAQFGNDVPLPAE